MRRCLRHIALGPPYAVSKEGFCQSHHYATGRLDDRLGREDSRLLQLHYSDIPPDELAVLANGMSGGCTLMYEDMYFPEAAEFDPDSLNSVEDYMAARQTHLRVF